MASLPLQSYISQGGTNFQRTYRRRELRMGDGFSQRVPDGLNAAGWKGTIAYDNLSLTDFTSLISFIDGIGSWSTFDYTPPGAASASKFSVNPDGMSINISSGNLYSVTIQVQTEFDLA
jgi:phage-related protein